MQRFHPVHLRHHMIQKNQVKMPLLHQTQTLRAPVRVRHLNLRFLKQTAQHLAVDGIVIHHQNLRVRRINARVIAICIRRLTHLRLKVPNRRIINNLLLQFKEKFGALSIFTLHLQPAAQKRQKLNGNIHAKSAALDIAVPVLLNPFKLRRQLRQVLLFNANPCIFYFKPKMRHIPCVLVFYPQPHSSFMCVFDRIGQNIGQNLTQAYIISVQTGRNCMVNLYRKAKIFIRRPLCRHIHQIMNETAEIIQNRHNLHFTGFNLGKVQNIVNQRQQRLPRRIDIHRIFPDIAFFRFTQNHFVHAKHRINRRAYFVGHVR